MKEGVKERKLVTKRDGRLYWVAIRKDDGFYYCWFDETIKSKNLILAGNLYHKSTVNSIRRVIEKEKTF